MKKTIIITIIVTVLIGTNSLKAADDWDIYSNVTIESGEYNVVSIYDSLDDPPIHTTVDMYGGSISVMGTYDTTTVNFSGGSISHLWTFDDSEFNFSGGAMNYIWTYGNSQVTIFGTDFNFELGEITATHGKLTGTLASGEAIDGWVTFDRYDNSSIVLVPEACTVSLLGFGAIVLCRKRRQ